MSSPYINGYAHNNYVTDGLRLYLDAANYFSYPATGTTWTNLNSNTLTATLVGSPLPTYDGTAGLGGSGSFSFASQSPSPANDQYAQCSGSLASLTEATLFAFIRRVGSNTNYNGIIFTRGNGGVNAAGMNTVDASGSTLGWHWDGNPGFGTFSGLSIPAPPTPPSVTPNWCMVAVTFKPSTKTVIGYLGKASGITSVTASNISTMASPATFGDIEIAGPNGFGGRSFTGNLSIAMIYDRALSATEITQNFDNFKYRYTLAA